MAKKHKSHFFEGSKGCQLCGCGPKTQLATKKCRMEKWVVEIVVFWTKKDFDETEGESVFARIFGKSREAAEERALKKWRAKQTGQEPLHVWAFGLRTEERKDWVEEWKQKRAQKMNA